MKEFPKDLPFTETQLNDLLAQMWSMHISVDDLVIKIRNWHGDAFTYESDFGYVRIEPSNEQPIL